MSPVQTDLQPILWSARVANVSHQNDFLKLLPLTTSEQPISSSVALLEMQCDEVPNSSSADLSDMQCDDVPNSSSADLLDIQCDEVPITSSVQLPDTSQKNGSIISSTSNVSNMDIKEEFPPIEVDANLETIINVQLNANPYEQLNPDLSMCYIGSFPKPIVFDEHVLVDFIKTEDDTFSGRMPFTRNVSFEIFCFFQ